MGDRTTELRDLFESVTGTESVTERQQRSRGTLGESDAGTADLQDAIESMRATLSFETNLSTSKLVTVVEQFYDGKSDAAIAERLWGTDDSVDPSTVVQARLDLHLVRESDRPPQTATSQLEVVEAGQLSVTSAAADLDCAPSTVRRYLAVRKAQAERRRVADRYRQRFESLVADADIAERLTASLETTGLDEAVADQDVDVDL